MRERIDTRKDSFACLVCAIFPKTFWLDKNNIMANMFSEIAVFFSSAFLFQGWQSLPQIVAPFQIRRRKIGFYMGALFGKELAISPLSQMVPVIIPVPMTVRKRRKRGYNQAEWFAAGIAAASGWKMNTASVRRVRENNKSDRVRSWRTKKKWNMPLQQKNILQRCFDRRWCNYYRSNNGKLCLAILDKNPGVRVHFAALAYVE